MHREKWSEISLTEYFEKRLISFIECYRDTDVRIIDASILATNKWQRHFSTWLFKLAKDNCHNCNHPYGSFICRILLAALRSHKPRIICFCFYQTCLSNEIKKAEVDLAVSTRGIDGI
jgi:hypothetical protein